MQCFIGAFDLSHQDLSDDVSFAMIGDTLGWGVGYMTWRTGVSNLCETHLSRPKFDGATESEVRLTVRGRLQPQPDAKPRTPTPEPATREQTLTLASLGAACDTRTDPNPNPSHARSSLPHENRP